MLQIGLLIMGIGVVISAAKGIYASKVDPEKSNAMNLVGIVLGALIIVGALIYPYLLDAFMGA